MTLTMMQTSIQTCIDFAGTPNSVKLFLYTILFELFSISISVHFFDELCDNCYEHNEHICISMSTQYCSNST